MNPRIWRAVAIAIALAAVLDPAFVRERAGRPDVAVVAATPSDSALARQVAGAITRDFSVVRAPLPSAAATVIAGASLPPEPDLLGGAGFAVAATPGERRVALEQVIAPNRVSLDARVPVEARLRLRDLRGRSVDVALAADGVTVDRATIEVTSADTTIRVRLSHAAAAPGAVALEVAARASTADVAHVDLVTDIVDERHGVLFFDRRPSWMSTFVRRAVEEDRRFAVASRILTSRNVSTDAGSPPSSLDDPLVRDAYDVIVIGAPDRLTDRDIAGLDAFLRRRGGSVILLFDQRDDGAHARLTGVSRWQSTATAGAVPVWRPAGDTALRAAEFAWPERLPVAARPLAVAAVSAAAGERPVLWDSPVGAGRLIVSTALDAWRYRADETVPFDESWRAIVASAAASAQAQITARVAPAVLAPGEPATLTVMAREAALAVAPGAGGAAAVAATAAFDGEAADSIRLLPSVTPGVLSAHLRAPYAEGVHRVAVVVDGQRVTVPIVVRDRPGRATPEAARALEAWTASRGGSVFSSASLGELRQSLRRAVDSPARSVVTRPMRSAWWLLPFALALGAEWWWRRTHRLA